MKKVLIVFHDADFYSGATRSMLDLVTVWNQHNDIHVSALFPEEGTATEYLKNLNISYFTLKYYIMRKKINSSSMIFEFSKGEVKKIISLWEIYINKKLLSGFDIIYSNTGSILMGYYISKILKKPHIWHIREFGALDQERICYKGDAYLFKCVTSASVIIAISNSVKKYLVEQGVKQQKIQVIYNDINYTAKPKVSYLENEITILSCGGIAPQKGHLIVIKAVQKLIKIGMKVNLIIAGNTKTEYYSFLKKYLDENGLNEYVKFVGFIKDISELHQICDISVVASTSEAFGRVTIESMLDKLLVIGADKAGTAELIIDNKTGLIFKSGDVESLCDKIIFAIEHKEKMQLIINQAYHFALNFQKARAANSIEKIIQDIR
jgi:glycosyltransferase involved in cell wall biosynthesis